MDRVLQLEGVRTHNLTGFDLTIPLERLVVISGVSGSGKSSLAFDTIAAEGQRRYLEALPTDLRLRLPKIERPPIQRLSGLPPTLAIAQFETLGRPGTLLAAAGGLFDTLRLLLSLADDLICPQCQTPVTSASPATIAAEFAGKADGRLIVGYPLETPGDSPADRQRTLRQAGMVRLMVGDEVIRLDDWTGGPAFIVLDRITIGPQLESRLAEVLPTAFAHGSGSAWVRLETDGQLQPWQRRRSERSCRQCDAVYLDPEPRLWRLPDGRGVCSECTGAGHLSGGRQQPSAVCPQCQGRRFNAVGLAPRLLEQSLDHWLNLTLTELSAAIDRAPAAFAGSRSVRGVAAWEGFGRQARTLVQLGLGHLRLDRPIETLSTGESRRVVLAGVLANGLTQSLLVLDEPTAGLHPADILPVLSALRERIEQRTSVIMVEHDPMIMRSADHLIELGPGAGSRGGKITFAGPPLVAERDPDGPAPVWAKKIVWDRPVRAPVGWLRLRGVRKRFLQGLDVDVPLGCLCVVAGVSGAGKSTLVFDALLPAVSERLRDRRARLNDVDDVIGFEKLDEVSAVTGAGLGRTPRANALTYVKAFDEVRTLFADAFEARAKGLSAGAFSFNNVGGRCERCEGQGTIAIDLAFLSDHRSTCPECNGLRYQRRLLDVKVAGKNIAEVLQLTVRQALRFFSPHPKITSRLQPLAEVGLDYIRLGQPLATYSGGESTRLKLAQHLGSRKGRRNLLILEEPTAGLHPTDIDQLVECFGRLVDIGHSVLAIEHRLRLIAKADFVIELGPGAGPAGGQLVAAATPWQLAQLDTPTGRALAEQICDDEE